MLCRGLQLATVCDEYSKQCYCVFTVECVFVEHRFNTVFSKRLYLGKNMKKSLRFCTKDTADMCCQPAQGLKAPPAPTINQIM